MSDDDQDLLAGFTGQEWRAALTPLLGAQAAHDHVDGLARECARAPSNGFSLSADSLALLSLVNESCAQRVEALLRTMPASYADQVVSLAAYYRDQSSP